MSDNDEAFSEEAIEKMLRSLANVWREEVAKVRAEYENENDRLREALELAKADIEEWIRCHPGDHYDSGKASDRVLAKIDAALAKEAGQ